MSERKEPFIGVRREGPCWVSMMIGAVLAGFLISIPVSYERKTSRAKAVELGAAEWRVDQKTGKTEFAWKEAKP